MKRKILTLIICGQCLFSSVPIMASNEAYNIITSSESLRDAIPKMSDDDLFSIKSIIEVELEKRDIESGIKDSSTLWSIRNYVDDFGDKTEEKYIGFDKYIVGTFSNSATTDSELYVQFLIDKANGVAIQLLEYGNSFVKAFSDTDYSITVKRESGEKFTTSGTMPKSNDRIYCSDSSAIIDAISSGEDVSFYIEISNGAMSTYLFTIPGDLSFEEKYDSLK